MKKFFLIATVLMSSFFAARAQDDQAGDQKKKPADIEALYVAYVTKQLELTPDEAQKFWPVHTQFTNEVKAVKQDLPELDKQQAILNIKKKYQDNFNRIIGPKRCERFFKLRDDFNRKLLERLNRQRALQQRPKLRRGI